jgi:hypothetical protein
MEDLRKPVEKVGIDEAASEKLSNKIIDAIDKIKLNVEIGNPNSFYIHLTREGCEVKARWTRAVAGIAGIMGLIKLLF